jgi:hypothetical protein
MKLLFPTLVGGCALVIGGYAALDKGGAARSPTSNTPVDAPKAGGGTPIVDDPVFGHELAALKAEVSALRAEMKGERGDRRRTLDDPADEAKAPNDDVRAWSERKAEVGADFEREPADPKWAPAMSSALRAAFEADATLKPNLRSVDCRSETCRIEVTEDAAASKSLPLMIQRFGDSLPTVQADHRDDGHGHLTMVLYFTRS